MAIREVRTIGDEVLGKISKPVKEVNERTLQIIEDMFETMYETGGVGIAAPQVGILKRIVCMDVGDGNQYLMINPEIIELSGGGLRADITARIVYVDGNRAEMTPKEYDLFFYMLKNKNIALTRDRLISEVWGYDYFGDDRTLDTHIKLLRKSLGKYSDYIVTLRGVGYRFDAEI